MRNLYVWAIVIALLAAYWAYMVHLAFKWLV
jgi:hypothetical protein